MAADIQPLSLEQQIALLRESYIATLPSELSVLQTLLESVQVGALNNLIVIELCNRLHKLAGSGGTFGLQAFGAHARHLELRLDQLLQVGTLNAQDLTFLQQGIALLHEKIHEQTPQAKMPTAQQKTEECRESVYVWLVDDDEALAHELARQLESFGYEVRVFTRVADANAAVANSIHPDILLMDVMFESEKLNSTQAFKSLPGLRLLRSQLLFMSSNDDFDSRVRAAQLGAFAYVLKPIDVPKLVARMVQIQEKVHAPPQRVLIIDDDLPVAEHCKLVLMQAGMDAEVLEDPRVVIDKIAQFRPELILMDMNMPQFNGPDLSGVIRQYDSCTSLPIVYLSAETDVDRQLGALTRGADDFLTKPISDSHLVAAVRVRVERARELAVQISRDSLTGLLKHANIKDAAQVELQRARRSGLPVCFAMLDIDHFKPYNDLYGHQAGDDALKNVAAVIAARVQRPLDIAARYGGEEFALVLYGMNQQFVTEMPESLRQDILALGTLHEAATHTKFLSVSIGMAVIHPDSGRSLAGAIQMADEALYQAKEEGRNRVVIKASGTTEIETGRFRARAVG